MWLGNLDTHDVSFITTEFSVSVDYYQVDKILTFKNGTRFGCGSDFNVNCSFSTNSSSFILLYCKTMWHIAEGKLQQINLQGGQGELNKGHIKYFLKETYIYQFN